ncbi:kinase-like protein [Neocallimastix lanati (nom. inval.)]|jgi:serine/threonine protein kinase|uniref:Kinase-like protein n=1 Tax=Neocallimastix californiae TaxID=1754190 RepID=A0A1Y2FEB6_9FUNG|nr:kinase-like protein [Neocallimastix sp. JGI-2020a]ORY82290.1 kinase-like protein [Neocallimastix californiae]|eukprot:ORY82290.1 kinase-like protein [Neocallimastix californiae]
MSKDSQFITNQTIRDKEESLVIDNNTGQYKVNSDKKLSPLITTVDTESNTIIDNSITPTVKLTNNNNNNTLPNSSLISNKNDQIISQSTPILIHTNPIEVESNPSASEKKRSFLFHKPSKNKPRSFSLNFKSSSHSKSNSPNLSFTSLNQNNNSNSSVNNSSSISFNSSSASSLNSYRRISISQSSSSLCPESVLSNQPLRSESSLSLKQNKSESHLNLLNPSQENHKENNHHHHLFFHSLDRHHSHQSSSLSSNPSLKNSEYSSSLAIPPHHSSLSLSQINSSSPSETSTNNTTNNNNINNNTNKEMLRNASSRSTLNSTKLKNESISNSPVPMGMSIDDYEIGAQIGNGSSAVVYVGKFKPSQKTVCLKVIDLDMFERNQIDGLRKEIQIMSLCKHPNILTVYGSFVHESKLYIVTPLLSAGSCLNIMKYAYPDGFEEVVIATILKQALLGLEYLHKNGLIHRDVKAGNLLMSEEGLVQLADFGVSSSLMETGERKGLRKTFVGTPCWMAPEVMEQSGYDYKADIWSFGITALEMATGRAPFAKYPPIKVLMLTIENEPPTLDRDQCRHKYSRTFKEMIDLCLNKDPSKRPSAEKLLQHPFFKQAKKKSYLADTILQNVPSIQMRPIKVVKPQKVENENITWDFDSDDEDDKLNKNDHSNFSTDNTSSEANTPSPPKYYMHKDSSSELGGLPKKSRFIIDTNESAMQRCESPASLNNNTITSLNRNNSLYSNSTYNNSTVTTNNNTSSMYESSSSLKFNNSKPVLGRHLSLADKTGSYSNDNLIIEKRSRFEVSSHPTPNTAEPKQSRFIIDEGRRPRLNSEPPSRHSSNGSIASSNNSINSNSYPLVNGVNGNEMENLKTINRKLELLMQNSERQNKLIEALSFDILQNKITRSSIYNTSEMSDRCIVAAEALMEKLTEMLKELDYLKKENEVLKQSYEKTNKLNGQLNQKLMALEQENNMLMQRKNNLL